VTIYLIKYVTALNTQFVHACVHRVPPIEFHSRLSACAIPTSVCVREKERSELWDAKEQHSYYPNTETAERKMLKSSLNILKRYFSLKIMYYLGA
jgi:hypothetical protein